MPAETPLEALARWEDAGAGWRLSHLDADGGAVVELLTCHGEAVDQLASGDPALLQYLKQRPASTYDEPA